MEKEVSGGGGGATAADIEEPQPTDNKDRPSFGGNRLLGYLL